MSTPAAAQAPAREGRPIVDIIAEMRERGAVIIYSDELLSGDMRALEAPSAADPFDSLREMLRPHGLTLERGPRDSWLVVRDGSAAATAQTGGAGGRIPLALPVPSLEEVVVSASRYSISRDPGGSMSQIDRIQLENTPTLGEDALRATHSLPGLTSSGLTAQVNVRGGTSNEALLFLDGVQLFNPFHLKDFQSLFSSIDPNIVDSMTVFTGAFPAQFGNRMSAVMEMRTIDPIGAPLLQIGASLLTTSALTAGSFDDGRGSWVTSLRRGNLDLLINAADSQIGSPEYLDAFGKIRYDISDTWTLNLGVLALNDEITLYETNIADASAAYDDRYIWVRADYSGDKLSASYLLSATELQGDRAGAIADPVTSTGALTDDRRFESTALKGDWTYRFNESHLLSWGAELRSSRARYRYSASLSESLPIVLPEPLFVPPSSLDEDVRVDGNQRTVYLSYRARPFASVTTEIGLRWDYQDYLADPQSSPRFNVLFDLSERLRLRASWGKYFQVQNLDELQVNNGLPDLFLPQESEHYVLGLEYVLDDGTSIRLEAYRKEIEQIQPRSENLFARVSLLPELLPDRATIAPVEGESTGIELSADGEHGRWRWWGSLARARTYDLFADGRAARSWEEPWSLKLGSIRTGDVWNLALTTTWHSGWPISTLSLSDGQLVASDFNGRRFGEFGSVDLRVSRDVRLARSELEWYLSVINVFGRDNPCCVDYDIGFDPSGQPSSLTLANDHWLSVVPNVGILWRFARTDR